MVLSIFIFMKPVIMINFKTYEQSTGAKAVKLAKICESVSIKTGVDIVVAVQNVDLYRVSQAVKIPVYAQHIDPVEFGAHTGSQLAEALRANGAKGVLINHSEDRMKDHDIEKCVARANALKLKTVICAPIASKAAKVAGHLPTFVAVEPPELIGTGISVTSANPKIITRTKDAVEKVSKLPILCGAGVSETKDVAAALKLGMSGVLLASGVTKAKDPRKVLMDLCKGVMNK